MRAEFMHLTITAFAALMLLLPDVAKAGTYDGPDGRYCGTLASSGQIVDADTKLKLDPDGRISGTYQFRDGDSVTNGNLQEEEKGPGLTKMLRWTDKYGKGRLVITFDSTFHSFYGHWGTNDAVPNQLWTGDRCQEPNS